MSLVKTQGIIIGEINTGEADKILTIFTGKHGKIKAAFKGVRRPKSNLVACSQFLVFSDFIFFKGKELYNVNSCDLIEPFYNIRNDLIKLTYASYAAEVIREVIPENMPSYRVLQLFLNTLFALSETEKVPEMIIRAFEFKLISLIGYKPHVDDCAICRQNNKECLYFSFEKSGLACADCVQGLSNAMLISRGTVNALRYIIKSHIKKLFSFNVNELVLKELRIISEIYLKDKLEKEFKTLKFLDKI